MMRQYETFEICFTGPEPQEGWAQPDLAASFSRADRAVTVKGFYDGEGQYVVRFLPDAPGEYAWQVRGVVNADGRETCESARNARGPVRAVGTHFETVQSFSLSVPRCTPWPGRTMN